MKIRNILYISAIMLLAGCSKDADISNSTTLSGNGEKTPLLINATLDTGKGQTRAVGETFADGDELKVYIRHITGESKGSYTPITAGQAPKLVSISVTSDGESPSLSPIYWDDYSDNTDAAKDLRTSGHGLQSYYAYCYNGGSPNSLTESTGVLTWTVQTDQRPAAALQHSDLLWSPEQTPVSYDHNNNNTNTFPVPFTHAMSQITVELTANSSAGFSGDPLASTTLNLNNMHTQTTLTAPTSAWVDVPGTEDANIKNIAMYGGTTTTGLTRTYTAIVAPGTILKKGVKLLDITGADGNNYEVIITEAMLDNTDGWGKYHTDGGKYGEDGGNKYIVTQPGVNYHLRLSIDKSAVQVSASLENWSTVEATGTGDIKFPYEEVGFLTPNTGFANTSAFSLFRVVNSNNYDTPEERTNEAYTYATVSTYDGNKWNNSPSIYWPNKDDYYYFRALANVSSGDPTAVSPTLTTAARGVQASNEKLTSIALSDGGYILWGTTAAHNGTNGSYTLGAAIPPRTGGVPMGFWVVNKCKVSFDLETAGEGAAVVLTGATISISNIYNTGTINLEDGTVTGSATTTLEETNSIPVTEVLAQKISADAVVTVTLAGSGGVYTIPLKNCVISGGTTPITVWEGGHTYNYTIHVEKEDVKFSAVVKPWTTVLGSGTASLNW